MNSKKVPFIIFALVLVGGIAYAVYASPSMFKQTEPRAELSSTTASTTNATTTKASTRETASPKSGDFIKGVYKREGNQIFIAGEYSEPVSFWKLFPTADAATFVVLEPGDEVSAAYAKDASHVYAFNRIIPYADPATFKILEYGIQKDVEVDKNALYYYNMRVAIPDALSYQAASSEPIASGAIFLAKGSELYKLTVSQISPDSWETKLNPPQLIPNGDPATLTPIVVSGGSYVLRDTVSRPIYYKDKNQVYCGGKILTGADPNTIIPVKVAPVNSAEDSLKEPVVRDSQHGYNERCEIVQ